VTASGIQVRGGVGSLSPLLPKTGVHLADSCYLRINHASQGSKPLFHDQPLNDGEHNASTKSLGHIELNTANNVTRLDQRRLGIGDERYFESRSARQHAGAR
jgi:hypothetical protein